MKINKYFKVAAVITLLGAISFSFLACTNNDKQNQAKPSSDVAEKKAKAYEEYKTILSENESKIKAYNWQTTPGESTYEKPGIQRQVAITDIDGDEIPELIFMSAENEYQADLHIYRFNGESAEELNYPGYENFASSGKFADVQAAAGSSYAVYKGKEPNILYLYNSIGDVSFNYYINKYKIKDGKLNLEKKINKTVFYDFEKNTKVDTYKIDEKEVTKESGVNAINKAFGDFDKTIIFSTYRDESKDIDLWNKVDFKKAICYSYDKAIEELSK